MGPHPYYSQSQVVYAYNVYCLSIQRVCLAFIVFCFFWPDINTEMGAVIYIYLIILIPNEYGFISLTFRKAFLLKYHLEF